MSQFTRPSAMADLVRAPHGAQDPASGDDPHARKTARRLKPSRRRLVTLMGAVLVVLSLLAALTTFLIISGSTPIVPIHEVVVGLFVVNGLIILALMGVVGLEAFALFQARRQGAAAAGLHVRIVALFSLIAVLPAILVAVVATITLERGLDPWFSERMREVVFKSVDVADAYATSQCRNLARESRLLADDVTRARPAFDADRTWFEVFLTARATALGLPVVQMMREPDQVIMRARLDVLADPPLPAPDSFAEASASGDPICAVIAERRIFSAISRLQAYPDTYLYIARQVDALAVEFPQSARQAALEYVQIDSRRRGVQVAFASMYVLITLTVLLSAAWLGISFANRLVAPIRRLIHATDEVASGNYAVQVALADKKDDLTHLGATFNKMTAELRRQRDGLVAASDMIDRRRRFTETVLAGVSAGIVGLDHENRVTLLNRSGEMALAIDRRAIGRDLTALAPELAEIIHEARAARQRTVGKQISLMRQGRDRTLNIRVSREGDGQAQGLVVTLDDITDLVTAQRTSAWADVARRIAHEIKNPLTPIQLSAERIKRKFGKVIVEDRAILDQCTDTIVRQVDDIRQMVDEFSSFARMPKPSLAPDDLAATLKQVVFLMRVGNPELRIEERIEVDASEAIFDRRLISQALTNVIKNATEAISGGPEPGKGRIDVVLRSQGQDQLSIDVMDNGKGFPAERHRLLEPYMTTREGGTGLGLAIVGKIFEDHGGRIELLDRPDGERGACVRMWLPALTSGRLTLDDATPLPEPTDARPDPATADAAARASLAVSERMTGAANAAETPPVQET